MNLCKYGRTKDPEKAQYLLERGIAACPEQAAPGRSYCRGHLKKVSSTIAKHKATAHVSVGSLPKESDFPSIFPAWMNDPSLLPKRPPGK